MKTFNVQFVYQHAYRASIELTVVWVQAKEKYDAIEFAKTSLKINTKDLLFDPVVLEVNDFCEAEERFARDKQGT